MKEIGSCDAVLRGVKTMVDGSIKIELEINPSDKKIVTKLMELYADNMRFLSVGFVSHEE
jgi:hypothetical protein